jgi:hypothetical protein
LILSAFVVGFIFVKKTGFDVDFDFLPGLLEFLDIFLSYKGAMGDFQSSQPFRSRSVPSLKIQKTRNVAILGTLSSITKFTA